MIEYFEINYDAREVTKYERHGKCHHCGECCRADIGYHCTRDWNKEYEEGRAHMGHGCTHSGRCEGVLINEIWYLISNVKVTLGARQCSQLTDEGLCLAHSEKDYKNGSMTLCDLWPVHPDHIELFPACGYSFEKVATWDFADVGWD